jgi:hypothetical protein
VDHPLPWLRYVDADGVDDDMIEFDGMDVASPTGEHLGNVDGFIVDTESGRPYYVVVDAGGWFKSKHFLLPVGHARFDADEETLVTDIDRDRVNRFPGFNKDEFDKLTPEAMKRLNDDTCSACSIEGVAIVYAADEPMARAWNRPDYNYPDWWRANPTQPERMGARAVTTGAETGRVRETSSTEAIRMKDESRRDEVRMKDVEPSPHHDGRAQPGDVLGVETGGEQTHIGDTAEDEDDRRRDAEKADRKRP